MDKTHEKHIQTLRLFFLDNITDVEAVLDGLWQKKIFTDFLKDKVESKQGKRAQLLELLVSLPRRGQKAFDVFHEVLVECGEYDAAEKLCPERAVTRGSDSASNPTTSTKTIIDVPDDDELPEKWPDFEAYDPSRVRLICVSDLDPVMNQRFLKAANGRGSAYPMHRKTRGIFLLISNEFFSTAELDHRHGTTIDFFALKNLFEQLGFETIEKFNRTSQEMLADIEKVARMDHSGYDCFACSVLTHGERDAMYGVEGNLLAIDDFKYTVDGDHCPTLLGKPKLFFIQACQGKKVDGGAQGGGDAGPDPTATVSAMDKEVGRVAKQLGDFSVQEKCDSAVESKKSAKSEFFVGYATIPEFVSWRNTEYGTWFIQSLVYVFANLSHKYQLVQLMTKVNRLVGKAETSFGRYKQVSRFESALDSEFYFFPGLYQEVASPQSEVDVASKGEQQQARVEDSTGSGIIAHPTGEDKIHDNSLSG